jgi:PAS domain S-box-containing protein
MSGVVGSAKPVLLVEDDQATAELELRVLTRNGIAVQRAAGVAEALALLRPDAFMAVLLDYKLPDGEPWTVVDAARSLVPPVPVILVTAMGSEHVASEALRRGVADYIKKADSFWDGLPGTVERVVKLRQVERNAALEDAEERSRRLFEATPAMVHSSDAQGRLLAVSDTWLAKLGYARAEVIGKPSTNFLTQTSRDYAQRVVLPEFFRTGRCENVEYQMVRGDGKLMDVLVSATLERDAQGEAVRTLAVIEDVTGMRAAEAALVDQQQRLAMATHANEIGLWDLTLADGTMVWNEMMFRIFGRERETFTGRYEDFTKCLHPEDAASCERELREAIEARETVDLEFRVIRSDGQVRDLQGRAVVFRDQEGRATRVMGANYDVTECRQIKRELAEERESRQEAMRKAEHANLAKSQFLVNMSHEMSTPMNAVMGLSYLLEQTALDEQQSAFLAKMRLASNSLLGVINDVLDLSKIEAGELMVERAKFSLRNLLKEICGVMAVSAAAKTVAFEIDAPGDLPAALEGDRLRLKQILTNLLSNAIKFTDQGGVKLSVRQLGATPESVKLHFAVRDTGIGIEPEVQSRLFAPFAQADGSATRRFGGTGLGLSIVKHLVGLLGGKVGLSSTFGVGSEFWVELEFGLASAESLDPQPTVAVPDDRPGLRGARVLVVDDSDINLEVARRILELEGAQVSLAGNGQEAVELLRAQPQAFDVVLMDVQMPVMDGNEATRGIRGDLGLSNLPILALTAGALASERQRARAAGMDDFISKPFDARSLVSSILRHVRPTSERAAAPVAPAAQSHTNAAAVAWPQIEGIDANDVGGRLGGDVNLFRSLLQRFLEEFAVVDLGTDTPDAAALALHAGRLHKLGGCGGLLGAKAINRLAIAAEAACRSGERECERAAQLTKEVASLIRQLRHSAAPFLEATRPEADQIPVASDDDVDPQLLAELIDLLRQQCLSAVDRFTDCSPQLLRRLGKESYERMRDHVDNLQFGDAAKVLEKQLQ